MSNDKSGRTFTVGTVNIYNNKRGGMNQWENINYSILKIIDGYKDTEKEITYKCQLTWLDA